MHARFPRLKTILVALISFCIGGAVAWATESQWQQAHPRRGSIIRELGDYKFISPILACEIAPDQIDFPELNPLKQKITDRVETATQNGDAMNISVYFRGMNGGGWIGVNENGKYLPASLAKVFIMMAYYRVAETNPAMLSNTLVFPGSSDTPANRAADPSGVLTKGQTYSIGDLIRIMITTSSNDALEVLANQAPSGIIDAIQEVYSDLGLPLPKTPAEADTGFVSPSIFSLAFRVLYGSTYLSHDMSERALLLLSQVTFKAGLVAGVPSTTTVAHKFGIATTEETGIKSIELHESGIVYYPAHPYLLCIMTKGKNVNTLAALIRDLSRIAYEFRTTQFPVKNGS